MRMLRLGPGRAVLRFLGPVVAVLCLGAALPRAVGAQPRGDFRIWAEERQERWGPFGISRDWEGSRVHGEGRFYPVNGGAWSVLVDGSEQGQELRFNGREIPTSLGRLSLQLGDLVVRDPREDPLRPEFQQTVWLRGATTELDFGPVGFGLRAGTLTERRGRFGWGRSPLGAQTFGAGIGGAWDVDGLWKIDWDRQEETPYRRGMHLVRFFFGSQPAEGWNYLGEMRFSNEDRISGWGNSLITGGGYVHSQFAASAHVRRISERFQGLGIYHDPHTNEWGGRLELSYRPRPAVLLGSSWDYGRDIETRTGLNGPEKRLTVRMFASAPLSGPFFLHTSMGYRNRSTDDPDSLLVDQNAIFWSSSTGFSTASDNAEIALTRTLFRDPYGEVGDWIENRYSSQYLRRLSDSIRGEVRGWTTRRLFLDGRWASTEKKLESQWTWSPSAGHEGWVRLGREFLEAADAGYSRDQWEFGAGWNQTLPWDLSLQVESLFFLRAGALEADRTRWNFRLSRRFLFGSAGPGRADGLAEFGSIRGRVFEDHNGNQRQDEGEPGLPGLVLRLGSGAETVTGPAGDYVLPEAATLLETLTFDVARLPTRYLAPEEVHLRERLLPGQSVTRNFPVRLAASVVGRVVLDQGDRAVGIPDVLLKVVGTHHDVFTDREGRFYIPGLEPGPATLEIVEWSLPKRAAPGDSLSREVMLLGGEGVNAGVFVLKEKPVPVQQIFRPEDQSPGR